MIQKVDVIYVYLTVVDLVKSHWGQKGDKTTA